MPYPRYQRKITAVLSDRLKKEFRNELFIQPYELHKSVREGMLSRGIKDKRLRVAIESGVFIPEWIENQRIEWEEERKLKYPTYILEMDGQTFYVNRKSILYPILKKLPKYVRKTLNYILPTAIGDREDVQEECGADLRMISKNIESAYANKEMIHPLLSDELITNMIKAWNIRCENKKKPPFGETRSGKFYVNLLSPCIPKNLA